MAGVDVGSYGVAVSVGAGDGVIVGISKVDVISRVSEDGFGSGKALFPNTVIRAAKTVAKKPIQATMIGTLYLGDLLGVVFLFEEPDGFFLPPILIVFPSPWTRTLSETFPPASMLSEDDSGFFIWF
jgi:hypothetical protein